MNSNNICLTSVNSRYSHTNLALLYLKTSLEQLDLKEDGLIFVEWDINRPAEELLERLAVSDCRVFIFSVYIWNSVFIKEMISNLRKLFPEAVICVGGPEAVYNAEQWLATGQISFILDGNAEDFAEDLLSIAAGPVPAVIKKQHKAFSKTPFPYTADRLKQLKGRIIYYEASRGCIYNCSYCLSSADTAAVEYRSIRQITEEIKLLSRFEGTVKFVDRTFNAKPSAARRIWQLMVENPPAGCFHFELHPMLLQEEDFRLIEKLPRGSAQFEIGIQSTDETILRNVNRPDRPAESFENIRRLIAMQKFHIHIDQIIGLPGDSPITAAFSMDRMLSLGPDKFQPGFLKILPGTPLSNELDRYGIKASAKPPYEVLETDSFTYLDLRRFKQIARLIEVLYNSGYFPYTLTHLRKLTGSWHSLFDKLLNNGNFDLNCKRWEYWGEHLLKISDQNPEGDTVLIKDLLRLDWCPFANSQRHPDFIRHENQDEMNRLKTEACIKIGSLHPELKKSELKRAILFIPECSENLPVAGSRLFVRTKNGTREFGVKNERH